MKLKKQTAQSPASQLQKYGSYSAKNSARPACWQPAALKMPRFRRGT
jgi:hypothetical protein